MHVEYICDNNFTKMERKIWRIRKIFHLLLTDTDFYRIYQDFVKL